LFFFSTKDKDFAEISQELKRVEGRDDVDVLLDWAVADLVKMKFEHKTLDDEQCIVQLIEEVASVVAGTLAYHDEL
jgi:hypothetical protein